jgi:hypothetical protein
VRSVQECVTSSRRSVLFDVDSSPQKLGRELVPGCTHGVAVGIDHQRWGKPLEVVAAGERVAIS